MVLSGGLIFTDLALAARINKSASPKAKTDSETIKKDWRSNKIMNDVFNME
jgi:hypothetical protein